MYFYKFICANGTEYYVHSSREKIRSAKQATDVNGWEQIKTVKPLSPILYFLNWVYVSFNPHSPKGKNIMTIW